MQRFELKELLLVSNKEKRAKLVKFDPMFTLLKGPNSTGKSSLIKSIYGSLGAEAGKTHPNWKAANVNSLVTIEANGKVLRILRAGRQFAVFSEDGKLLRSYVGITHGIGPFLSNLLNFRLQLLSQENELLVPPPAYMFLPFYIDQDTGWNKSWASFDRLSQFKNWRQPVAEYHTGIRPNQFYIAKGEAEQLQDELRPHVQKRDALRGLLRDLEERLKVASFSIDIDAYREEVKELLILCDRLKKQEEKVKEELVALYNHKTLVESQMAITRTTLTEINKDYAFATEVVSEEHVECPTCGANYGNSFAERFTIALDEERCAELLRELDGEITKLDEAIESANDRYSDIGKEVVRAEELLTTKQGEVELKDIIESAGRKEVQTILRKDISAVQQEVNRVEEQIAKRRALMQAYTSKERTKEISDDFRNYMEKFLLRLDVHSVPPESYRKVHSKVTATGSELPRSLLGYLFSILWTMNEKQPGSLCPIVIDSPNQQDLDAVNRQKVYNFIKDFQPRGSQVILALVDEGGIDFGGKVLNFSEKDSLLNDTDYQAHAAYFNHLMATVG